MIDIDLLRDAYKKHITYSELLSSSDITMYGEETVTYLRALYRLQNYLYEQTRQNVFQLVEHLSTTNQALSATSLKNAASAILKKTEDQVVCYAVKSLFAILDRSFDVRNVREYVLEHFESFVRAAEHEEGKQNESGKATV